MANPGWSGWENLATLWGMYRWLAAWMLICTACAEDLKRFVFEKPEMGVPFRVSLYAKDAESARKLADTAFARVEALNAIFSDYEDDSELSRLSRTSGSGQKVEVSAPLWTVLERAQKISEQSGGAFDVTCGPLTSVWRRARRKSELPPVELAAEMRERCGWKKMRMDPAGKTVELLAPQMRIDLGSLAKGYAVDAALQVLRDAGHPMALVAGGGDMAAGDPPPGRKGWRVDVEPLDTEGGVARPPRVTVELANCGIATSGDMFQRLQINGRRYSHILDMRTGQPLTDHTLVTAIGPDCFTASLSTTLCILGPEAGRLLAGEWKIEARWQRQPVQEVEIAETPGWIGRIAKSTAGDSVEAPAGK